MLAASSLFVIVDPLAVVPAYLAMTPNDTAEQRIRTTRLACCVTAGVLLLFSMAGQLVFKVMGFTMPAFQVAAGILPRSRKRHEAPPKTRPFPEKCRIPPAKS